MNCETCGSPKKVIPAGVSKKTGKSYNSFSVCESCNPSRKPAINQDTAEFQRRAIKAFTAIYNQLEAIQNFLLKDKQQEKFEKELEETPIEKIDREKEMEEENTYEEPKEDSPPF